MTHTRPRTRWRWKRRRVFPGTPPGTLHINPESSNSELRLMAYGPDRLEERTAFSPSEIDGFRSDFPVVWIEVVGLGDERLLKELALHLGLHDLALADVINGSRPKFEGFGSTDLLYLKRLEHREELQVEQIGLFLGEGYVVTFHEEEAECFKPIRRRIRDVLGRIRTSDAGYLLYTLLDSVVDSHFPILEQYGEELEELQDEVITRPDSDLMSKIHHAKHDLLLLRRAIWPLRDAIAMMTREPTGRIPQEVQIYLRDCYGHVVQQVDLIELYREVVSGLMDSYLSSISNRMNEVMKILTSVATIFIPLTFVAGIYGMNFDPAASRWNMPELSWQFGYPLILGSMLLLAVVMVLLFLRKGWLGATARRRKQGRQRARLKQDD